MKPITRLRGMMFLSGYSILASALADTTIDPANQYAYGTNIGWINAAGDNSNGAVIGRFYCSGFLYAANVGWISLGSGPTNGWQYGNNSSSDWGINHDGAGNLSGYAYGANIGWINFEQVRGKPRVNTSSGALSGYAWGANVGWINLDGVRTTTIDSGPDSDNDGLPDAWEIQRTGGTAALAGGGADADSDGSSDSAEYHADTDPTDVTSFLTVSSQEVGLASGNSVNLAWLSQQGISYSVMVSDDLINWTALNEQPIAGTGGELSWEFTFDGATRWLRISAWRSAPQ
jgi:hypothetical protein